MELASKSGVLASGKRNANAKEEGYTHEALKQAKTFLDRSEAAYKRDPKDQAVVQFARTSAQSAENARALAMGAVGGLLMRQLESELTQVRNELAKLRRAEAAAGKTSTSPTKIERVEAAPVARAAPVAPAAAPALVKQPALWFAVAGWAVALVPALSPAVDLAAGRRRADINMERPLTTLRFLASLLAPGGALVLATWAVQREEVVLSAAAPYAAYFCFDALVVAVLLSMYYDQARLLCSASVVVLTVLSLGPWVTDSNMVRLALVILLPLNFSLLAVSKERGLMTFDGLLKLGIVAAQPLSLIWIAQTNGPNWGVPLAWSGGFGVGVGLPWIAQLSFAMGALTLVTLVFRRRTKVEQGLLWALVAMFLGLNQLGAGPEGAASGALFFYSGTAGLILVFAVLEHGYDIAFRDELTGLPGRRAFNNVMEQLGGTYAIAMCDVDHFKRFNDAYGHDVGDQVLKMVAAKLSQVGGGGRAFRYGGEEFLVVFRGRYSDGGGAVRGVAAPFHSRQGVCGARSQSATTQAATSEGDGGDERPEGQHQHQHRHRRAIDATLHARVGPRRRRRDVVPRERGWTQLREARRKHFEFSRGIVDWFCDHRRHRLVRRQVDADGRAQSHAALRRRDHAATRGPAARHGGLPHRRRSPPASSRCRQLPEAVIVTRDEREARGPLEGIRAGLSALPESIDAAYITSCDVPLLVPAFVERMIELMGDHDIAVMED